MKWLEPSVLAKSSTVEFGLATTWLIGEVVQSVVYGLQPPVDRPPELPSGSVHVVDGYVEISMRSGKILHLTWGSPPREEGLVQLLADPGEIFSRDSVLSMDASELDEWKPIIGEKIRGYGLSFSPLGYPLEERTWSLRLGVGTADVVICLGDESRTDGNFVYASTSLLVIFDDVIAKAYHTFDGRSAWGEDTP